MRLLVLNVAYLVLYLLGFIVRFGCLCVTCDFVVCGLYGCDYVCGCFIVN